MRFASLLTLLVTAPLAFAQGYSPADALKRMSLPPGFAAKLVASEPLIRQPLSISYDERGRLWVLQYLQYPNPAGLKPVKQDQYLRTVWDRVPEPPPRGPKGLDKITILSEPNADGQFTKSHDFITGLNLATGFCIGRGGVFVVQPPYLLFYPDANHDDIPDRDPDVLLSGFGMEDSHSYANSLQWGPDGWLYGAHGSTVTAKIKNPAAPNEPPIEFQQGIWRYHPVSKRFELFSEGGGNTYGLDFDQHGQAIAGTNYGGKAMLHQVQGAYFIKGFSKHGPLHNPHAYGYFDHVPYKDFKGGHVTCGGVVYMGDKYPTEFQNQYIAGNLLSNAVYWHIMTHDGSTFTAKHGGDLLVANDTWFRPVDLLVGPDGNVNVVDWYDKRAAHLDPIDNWDKTNGRVYRIEFGTQAVTPPFDLRQVRPSELVKLLNHPNVWWRREARRMIVDRDDRTVVPVLKSQAMLDDERLALESLWTLASMGATTERDLVSLFDHRSPHLRAWAVRLLGDATQLSVDSKLAIVRLARTERDDVVRSQLACTAKRLPPTECFSIISDLVRATTPPDARLPLLCWWAVEAHSHTQPNASSSLAMSLIDVKSPLAEFLTQNIARRLLASDIPTGPNLVATLLTSWNQANRANTILQGIQAAVEGGDVKPTPALMAALNHHFRKFPSPALNKTLIRLGDESLIVAARSLVANDKQLYSERIASIEALRTIRDPQVKSSLIQIVKTTSTDALRLAAIGGLEVYDDPTIATTLLEEYARFSAAVKKRTVQALLGRPSWAHELFHQLDAGTVPKTDVSLDQARTAMGHDDASLRTLIEKQFGKLGPATPGEKQARISWLGIAIGRNKGDASVGKTLYTQHCGKCHQLFGEGTAIGPDLTTADRKNVNYMLANIVDPSSYIRTEFVQHALETKDGQKLLGLVVSATAQDVTLVDAENKKRAIARAEIDELKPLSVSLMPEKLLDTLTDQQVCDLFAYLRSEPPKKK